MDNILEVVNLRKEYREFTLKDISFSLPRGYIMGLIGPNGAGKTTTIKLIMNIINPDGGKVSVFGRSYRDSEEEIKNRIGYVGETQYFFEDMTVDWTERFISAYYEKWDPGMFDSLIKRFGVSRTKKTKELSKGMKVKLSLALALAHHPQLLILDEPTSGLDPVVRREILDMLLDLIQDDGKSVLMSSHITEDIEKIADYVTYIVDGNITLTDEKENILSSWKKIHIKGELATPWIKSKLKAVQENIFGISGMTDDYRAILEHTGGSKGSSGIRVENATLDDILISFVKGGKQC